MEGDLSQVIYKVDDSWAKVPKAEIFTPSRLLSAALAGNWAEAEVILRREPSLATARITPSGETILHIAAAAGEAKHERFVEKLVAKMEENGLTTTNTAGSTALHFAALSGNWKIASHLVKKNGKLAKMANHREASPLYLAALSGSAAVVEFLLPLSDFELWRDEDKSQILSTCIASQLYGIAREIVQQYPMLAVAKDPNGDAPLDILARKAAAFPSKNKLGWRRTIDASQQDDAFQLLERIWEQVLETDRESLSISGDIAGLAFVAAKFGNYEFLVKLLRECPEFLYIVNESSQSIYHIAVIYRHESIFSLIYEIGKLKDLVATYRDAEDNTILHLAARLAPPSQLKSLPGAALQMHRELLWYKEVEKIVPPAYRTMKNKNDQTPYELFVKEHRNLMEDGEKWMKKVAHSCMIVAALVAAMVFITTAFTVLGGKNNDGDPILLQGRPFMVFTIAGTITMLSSFTAITTFLSISVSHFTQRDFLLSFPVLLITGIATLVVSLAGMLVTSWACLFLYGREALAIGPILLSVSAVAPMMFISMKHQPLVKITGPLYHTRRLFRSRNRLFTK